MTKTVKNTPEWPVIEAKYLSAILNNPLPFIPDSTALLVPNADGDYDTTNLIKALATLLQGPTKFNPSERAKFNATLISLAPYGVGTPSLLAGRATAIKFANVLLSFLPKDTSQDTTSDETTKFGSEVTAALIDQPNTSEDGVVNTISDDTVTAELSGVFKTNVSSEPVRNTFEAKGEEEPPVSHNFGEAGWLSLFTTNGETTELNLRNDVLADEDYAWPLVTKDSPIAAPLFQLTTWVAKKFNCAADTNGIINVVEVAKAVSTYVDTAEPEHRSSPLWDAMLAFILPAIQQPSNMLPRVTDSSHSILSMLKQLIENADALLRSRGVYAYQRPTPNHNQFGANMQPKAMPQLKTAQFSFGAHMNQIRQQGWPYIPVSSDIGQDITTWAFKYGKPISMSGSGHYDVVFITNMLRRTYDTPVPPAFDAQYKELLVILLTAASALTPDGSHIQSAVRHFINGDMLPVSKMDVQLALSVLATPIWKQQPQQNMLWPLVSAQSITAVQLRTLSDQVLDELNLFLNGDVVDLTEAIKVLADWARNDALPLEKQALLGSLVQIVSPPMSSYTFASPREKMLYVASLLDLSQPAPKFNSNNNYTRYDNPTYPRSAFGPSAPSSIKWPKISALSYKGNTLTNLPPAITSKFNIKFAGGLCDVTPVLETMLEEYLVTKTVDCAMLSLVAPVLDEVAVPRLNEVDYMYWLLDYAKKVSAEGSKETVAWPKVYRYSERGQRLAHIPQSNISGYEAKWEDSICDVTDLVRKLAENVYEGKAVDIQVLQAVMPGFVTPIGSAVADVLMLEKLLDGIEARRVLGTHDSNHQDKQPTAATEATKTQGGVTITYRMLQDLCASLLEALGIYQNVDEADLVATAITAAHIIKNHNMLVTEGVSDLIALIANIAAMLHGVKTWSSGRVDVHTMLLQVMADYPETDIALNLREPLFFRADVTKRDLLRLVKDRSVTCCDYTIGETTLDGTANHVILSQRAINVITGKS